MSKKFTFEDYKKALQGAGPKLKKTIIERAIEDGMTTQEFFKLCDLAYPDPFFRGERE